MMICYGLRCENTKITSLLMDHPFGSSVNIKYPVCGFLSPDELYFYFLLLFRFFCKNSQRARNESIFTNE